MSWENLLSVGNVAKENSKLLLWMELNLSRREVVVGKGSHISRTLQTMQVMLYCFCLITYIVVPAINLRNKPEDEEELRDSLLFVDPFTQELELHLREAAIEFQLDWEKIKNSEKYANIFEKMTPEMLKVKYLS
jgi:hypothetical protein